MFFFRRENKRKKQQFYSEYNNALFEAERAILYVYNTIYLLIKDFWIIKIR